MNIEHLYMSFGLQEIFNDVSVHFNDDDKIGIVGVNGAGKSTLFNLILGNISPDSGKITVKNRDLIGYLPQVITGEIPNDDITVFEYLLLGRPIQKLKDNITSLYEQIAVEKDDKKLNYLFKKITKNQNKLEYYDEYNAESILLKIIEGMNISEKLLDLKLKNISGGQKSKVAFARLLYSKPEILLLDEPTNHLDLDTKDYIENTIKNYHGLYEKYLKIKNEKDKAKERLYEKQVKEEEKLKGIINKYIRGNEKKANIAKDRIKKLEKLQKEKVVLEKANKYTRFNIKINEKSYLTPLKVENLTFGYTKDNLLYQNLTFDLTRGEKLLVVGENGIGKTTLLKLIMGLLTPIEGNIIINDKTTISYYAQEHEILDNSKSILDNFTEFNLRDFEIRKILGSFLFSGDDIYKKVEVLSPGERSRVALAKVALKGANTLLLDEPTNHLDPMTQVIIADTFKSFEGTMLVVSHNLDFVDNLGISRMFLLPSGKIVYYDRDIVYHYEMINEEIERK